MNKITFPRVGVDGVIRSKEDIENLFFDSVGTIIKQRLDSKFKEDSLSESERKAISKIKAELKHIIIAGPEKLAAIVKSVDGRTCFLNGDAESKFVNKLSDAFYYKRFRENGVLVDLANWLNIKCCPYCNMQYTLYIDKVTDNDTKGIALFQFDHFYSKKRYPFLSMSLYNLIPCCPICNLYKKERTLSVHFNPYCGEISSYFTFKIDDIFKFLIGGRASTMEKIDVVLEWKTSVISKDEAKEFEDTTKIMEQCQRHKDVVDEIYSRVYLEKYYRYSNNFHSVPGFGESMKQRVVHGTYMNPKDIDKRPLAKLYQDLWKQAMWCLGMQK